MLISVIRNHQKAPYPFSYAEREIRLVYDSTSLSQFSIRIRHVYPKSSEHTRVYSLSARMFLELKERLGQPDKLAGTYYTVYVYKRS
jgi:hypothetical protein